MPDWYLDEPALLPGDAYLLKCFLDLDTGRPSSLQGVRSIRWKDIVFHAEYEELGDFKEEFIEVMRTLDQLYVEHIKGNTPSG